MPKEDAPVVQKLRSAGAIVLGETHIAHRREIVALWERQQLTG